MSGPSDSSSARPAGLSALGKAAICFLLLIFSVLYVKVITPFGPATSPDSLAYIEIADSIRGGHGVALRDRSLEAFNAEKYDAISLWPPAYPAVLAMVMPEAADLESIQWVSAVFLGLLLTFLFLILSRAIPTLPALLLSFLICSIKPLLLIYSYVWSETLFLLLYVVLFWAVINFLELDMAGSPSRRPWLLFVAILIAALFYTRFVAGFAPLVLLYLFYKSSHRKADLNYFIGALAVSAGLIVALIYRNYQVSGYFTGGDRAETGAPLAEIAGHVQSTLAVVFPSAWTTWFACLLASFLAIVLWEWRKPVGSAGGEQVASRVKGISEAALVLALLYVASLLMMRALQDFDSIGVRLLSPAFPIIWVFLFSTLFSQPGGRVVRVSSRIVALTVVLGLIVQGSFFYRHIREGAIEVSEVIQVQYADRMDYVLEDYTFVKRFGELSSLLTWNIPRPAIVATRSPSRAEFLTDMPAVSLPADYGPAFIEELCRTVTPKSCSLLFFRRSEFDQFQEVIKGYDDLYEEFPVEEGVLVVFY